MIAARPSLEEELEQFVLFESEEDTRDFIEPYSLFQHRECFASARTQCLSILENGSLVGFCILLREAKAVELRRVVVAHSARGIGQRAIGEVHSYCSEQLGTGRIWLDVFDFNERGKHIYSKLGYQVIGSNEYDGRKLIIMEKVV